MSITTVTLLSSLWVPFYYELDRRFLFYIFREVAEYLDLLTQILNSLVHDQIIILERGFEKREIMNIVNGNNETFDINIPFVRDAILYYTIQQYFNNNDKKTCEFIHQIEETHGFSFQNGLKMNIPLLSKLLNTTDKELYARYGMVKKSFANLTNDVILVKKGEQAYSKLLATTKEAPPYLFLKGNVHLLEEKSVCVVGSRNASEESMKKTERIVKSLVKRNIVVNAGLARGIDIATHTAALANGGRTIAVIGTPINQYYPKENKDLQIQIEKNGLVVSQFPPCNAINRWNFPTRNGVMSGISLATIIMEAGESSGALKQADYALKQGRDVLIPQSAIDNPLIQWPKKYVSKGAHAFKTLKEVLQILNRNELLLNMLDNDMKVSTVEMD